MTEAAFPPGLTPAGARALQQRLADRVVARDGVGQVRWVAGLDVHYPQKDTAHAVAALLRYPELTVAAVAEVDLPVTFPYVPGLLSFREAPAAVAALEALPHRPDLVFADGQGYAHPRRFGLACHLGVWLNLPVIGAAKSRLIGESDGPPDVAGAWSPLLDKGEVIGAVLRTRAGVKPLYVSVGHRVDLAAAIRWTLACCRGYRLPEPSRWAHRIAGGGKAPAGALAAASPGAVG